MTNGNSYDEYLKYLISSGVRVLSGPRQWATPMVSPSPSSPWASLLMRVFANLLRLENLRHVYFSDIQNVQNLSWQLHVMILTQVLDLAAENKTFLDAILAPPILTGVGKTSANIFVDGNNSRVSFLFSCCCCCYNCFVVVVVVVSVALVVFCCCRC